MTRTNRDVETSSFLLSGHMWCSRCSVELRLTTSCRGSSTLSVCAKECMYSASQHVHSQHGGGAVILVASRNPGKGKRGSQSAAATAARIERGHLKRTRTAGGTACVQRNHVDSKTTGTDGSGHPAAERTLSLCLPRKGWRLFQGVWTFFSLYQLRIWCRIHSEFTADVVS